MEVKTVNPVPLGVLLQPILMSMSAKELKELYHDISSKKKKRKK